MKIFSQQELEQKFATIPEDIQAVISSESIGNEVTKIGGEFRLHVDEMGILNEEIAFVMLGLVKPNEFEQRISERLQLDPTRAQNMVKAINERIFVSVRALVLTANQEKPVAIETQKPTPQTVIQKPEMDRANILAEIEDNPATQATSMADKKLNTPVTAPAHKAVIGTPKQYANDPYREPIA